MIFTRCSGVLPAASSSLMRTLCNKLLLLLRVPHSPRAESGHTIEPSQSRVTEYSAFLFVEYELSRLTVHELRSVRSVPGKALLIFL